ncbi:MAG: CRISPR-associated endonuclease Cas2 [Candidatus Hadarchaeum sp.]|uniref:CRISPR-associated endonuclease Cas2 n=1 Tax=Candidatus Hadarchaeum sp. TaxID=2883567 RepID=UPI003D0A57C2
MECISYQLEKSERIKHQEAIKKVRPFSWPSLKSKTMVKPMLALVIYDISSDEVRTKLASRLFDYGLQRVQYSAFKGELNAHDREILVRELRNYIGGERDIIYVVPLCDRCVRLCRIVSEKPSEILEKEEVKII